MNFHRRQAKDQENVCQVNSPDRTFVSPNEMTELQLALAEATHTDKKTAGIFLDTLNALAYKTTKKIGEFVLPGLGKLVKQKRKARTSAAKRP